MPSGHAGHPDTVDVIMLSLLYADDAYIYGHAGGQIEEPGTTKQSAWEGATSRVRL